MITSHIPPTNGGNRYGRFLHQFQKLPNFSLSPRKIVKRAVGVSLISLTGSIFLSAKVPGPDYQPLADLYTSTNGPGWTNKTGWLSGSDPCTGNGGNPWYGLGCTDGRVTQIDLRNNQLSGSIPVSLSAFTDLQVLYLHNNQLSGRIPASLSSLTDLQYLWLSNNRLSGSIPAGLASLTNLESLALNDNQLSGNIPASLSTLIDLQVLYLHNNQLSGSIPAGLAVLTRLESLALNDNQLTGSIPVGLDALVNLRHLYLNNNQLNGSIPASLGALPDLQFLYLHNNRLSGSIPASLGGLTNLQYLWLSNNELSGSIPADLATLTNLESLALNNNQLSGSIPANLNALANLESLFLNNNRLGGSIPASLDALTNLQVLLLSNNQLSGSIPARLSALTNLQRLALDNNQLRGCYPASLSALCSLPEKDFHGNPGLPGSGSGSGFEAFCYRGVGSDVFLAQAVASQPSVSAGEVVSLSANGGSGYTYTWSGPPGSQFSSTSDQVVSATLTTAGQARFGVVISSGGSCSSTASLNVTVNPSSPTTTPAEPDNVLLGLEEEKDGKLILKALPSPVQDAVLVEVLSPVAGPAAFQVLDASGRIRISRQKRLSEGWNQVEFRLGSLSTGPYLVRCEDALHRQAAVLVGLGVEESPDGPLNMKALPDPAQNAVMVEILSPVAGPAEFEVLDTEGHVRQSRMERLSEGWNEVRFRLGNLSTEPYLIRCVDVLFRQAELRVGK